MGGAPASLLLASLFEGIECVNHAHREQQPDALASSWWERPSLTAEFTPRSVRTDRSRASFSASLMPLIKECRSP